MIFRQIITIIYLVRYLSRQLMSLNHETFKILRSLAGMRSPRRWLKLIVVRDFLRIVESSFGAEIKFYYHHYLDTKYFVYFSEIFVQ